MTTWKEPFPMPWEPPESHGVDWHKSHFDLVEDYDGEIPLHVMEYLNLRKTNKTVAAIERELGSWSSLEGLDVGCGTGTHALTIQALLPNAHVHGLDASSRQLDRAQEKGFPNRLIHAPMWETNLETDSLDFVVAVNSIHHLPTRNHQEQTMVEFHRILRPGGIVIIHEINVTNPVMAAYVRYVFPRTRNIDDGSELFLKRPPGSSANLRLVGEDRFTFVPDFTPRWLMGIAERIDIRLSSSRLRVLGAHVMWVLKKS